MAHPTYTEIDLVLKLYAEGATVRHIAAVTGIGKSTVSRIVLGQRVCDNRAPPIKDVANGDN